MIKCIFRGSYFCLFDSDFEGQIPPKVGIQESAVCSTAKREYRISQRLFCSRRTGGNLNPLNLEQICVCSVIRGGAGESTVIVVNVSN